MSDITCNLYSIMNYNFRLCATSQKDVNKYLIALFLVTELEFDVL